MHKSILIVYDVAYPYIEGGGQRRMYEIAKRLISNGYAVSWLCFQTWEGPSSISDVNSGINYLGLPGFRGLYREDGSRRRTEPFEFLIAILRSKLVLTNYKFIWAGQWPISHLAWWWLFPKAICDSKLVVDWWEVWGGTWFSYSKTTGLLGYFLERTLIRWISSVGTLVVIAPAALRRASSLAPTGNIILIHNGIDLRLFTSRSVKEVVTSPGERPDITAGKISNGDCQAMPKYDLAYLGRLKNHKRVDLLLEAVYLLRERFQMYLSLVVMGDGPDFILLKRKVQELKIEDQIDFMGQVESNQDAYRVLESSRVFVNPSVKEGGGSITLLEAFAAGLPVVAFRCKDGIDPDLIGHGFSGILVDFISADELAGVLFDIFNVCGTVERLREGALQKAQLHDWDIIADQYSDVFRP